MSRRISIAVASAVLAVGATAPASAQAVTVGAPLGLAANTVEGCERVVLPALRPLYAAQGQLPSSCTYFGLDGAGAWTSQTPPGSWVIDQARVRTGPRVGPMVFTALRALRSKAGAQGIICCTGVAESQVFVPQPNSINTIPVRMPMVNTVQVIDGEQVEVVDYLGITLLSPASSVPLHVASGPAGSTGMGSYFAPALRNGQTAAGPGGFGGAVVLVNAEYQPAGSGPPTIPGVFALRPGVDLLARGNRARLGAAVPGPGLLRAASGARARVAALATGPVRAERAQARRRPAAKRRRPKPRKLLHAASVRVQRAGVARIVLRLTPAGRKLLVRRKRLRLPVTLTFTPRGGSPVRQTRKVTFKRPAPKRRAPVGRSR